MGAALILLAIIAIIALSTNVSIGWYIHNYNTNNFRSMCIAKPDLGTYSAGRGVMADVEAVEESRGARRRLSAQGLELLKQAQAPPAPPPKPDHFKPNWQRYLLQDSRAKIISALFCRSGIVQQLRTRGVTKIWKHVFLYVFFAHYNSLCPLFSSAAQHD